MGLFRRRSDDLFPEGDIIPSPTQLESVDLAADETTDRRHPKQEKMFKKEGYGIQQAIKLMRNLPKNDLDTVMTVVKQTLESMDIKVADIINDAGIKEKAFIRLLDTTRTELADFKEIVKAKEHEIVTLEAVLKETIAVKEKLMYVEEISRGQALDESVTIPEDHPHIKILKHENKPDKEDARPEEEIPNAVTAESIEPTESMEPNESIESKESMEPEAIEETEVPVLQQPELDLPPVSKYPYLETIELDRETASTLGQVIKDTITKAKSVSKSKLRSKSKSKSKAKTKSKAKSKTKSKGKEQKKETA